MGTYRQTFLYNCSTLVTLLAGETRIHSYHLVSGTCSLGSENSEELLPTGVHDGFRKMMVFDHVADSQVFHDNVVIALGIGPGGLEMVISALAIDLQMRLGHILGGLTSTVTAFLAPGQLALLASQGLVRAAIEPWVRHGMPFAIGKKHLEAHIDPDISM